MEFKGTALQSLSRSTHVSVLCVGFCFIMLVSFVCFCHTWCFQFAVVSFSDHRYSTLLHVTMARGAKGDKIYQRPRCGKATGDIHSGKRSELLDHFFILSIVNRTCDQITISLLGRRYVLLRLHPDWKSERLTGLTRKLGVSGVKDGEIVQCNMYIINTNDVPVHTPKSILSMDAY